ncbi:hypothetical protein AHAS_Ahas09G0152400 [Arachis hypogaea]
MTNEMSCVFFFDIEMEFNCLCMRMESFGIPCEHIVCILVHEDIDELPRSLVLPRWTKTHKEKDATQKKLANDVDSARDDVQVNAFGAGLGTNDMGHGLPRDLRICSGIDMFEDDLDDQVNIEDDQVYCNVSLSAIHLYIDPLKPSSRLSFPYFALFQPMIIQWRVVLVIICYKGRRTN